MTSKQFEQTLRQLLRAEPFRAFVVELTGGQQLLIDEPHTVSLGTEAAGFVTPEYEFYSIRCGDVQSIRLASGQPIS